jgi:phosphoribosylformimino-5-aminoimidazole carboxamide ribotide isomerase
MIAVPAVDLRDGACVQLVGGAYSDERVRRDDPRAVASEWAALGFGRLHLVDLDAATGAGANDAIVDAILGDARAATQVGGGIRTAGQIAGLLDRGATRVVVGTRALEEPEWLAEQATRFPGRLIVAADVRSRNIAVRGWSRTLAIDVGDAIASLASLPIAAVLVTAVDLEGRLGGPDLQLMEDLVSTSAVPVIASGGISSMQDLRALRTIGVESAVIGMALYTGALDARAVAQEFGI